MGREIDDVLKIIPKLVSTIVTQEVKLVADQLIENQKAMSSMFDDAMLKVQSLSNELQQLKRENENLKKSMNTLAEYTKSLQNDVDRHEVHQDAQYRKNLSCNAVITGIPRTANENTEGIVGRMLSVIGCKIPMESIVSCERIKSSLALNSPIKMVFTNFNQKQQLIEAKKSFGKLTSADLLPINAQEGTAVCNVNIRNDLTPLSVSLLHELRQYQSAKQLAYVWPGITGDILVKLKNDSKPIPIRSRMDVRMLGLKTQC